MIFRQRLMGKIYKGIHYSVRTSIPTKHNNSTFIKNTEYTGISKADQLAYHTRFIMFKVAKYS